MKAAVFHGPRRPLAIEDLETPSIGPDEALIQVAACGLCATDLHYLHGVPTFKKPPLVLGHEASGIVKDVGKDVANVSPGDRVLVPPVLSCGFCSNCRVGRDNLCENILMVGNHVDGAFAEYVKVPAKDLIRLPNGLPLEESCIISDAISTAFHAIKNRGEVKLGDSVAIFGCGGVGINAVQIAATVGATVYAVDIDERKLEVARSLGAAEAINGKQQDPVKRIRELTGGRGVDAAFEVIGDPATMDQAFKAVRWGGRVVIVGYSSQTWGLEVGRLMFREISVLGSLGCRSAEFPKIVKMVADEKIKLQPVITGRFRLERINEALKDLEEGKAVGRLIIVPA